MRTFFPRFGLALLAAAAVFAFTAPHKPTSSFNLNVGSADYKIFDGDKEVYSIAVGQYPALDEAIKTYNETGKVVIPKLPSSSGPAAPSAPRPTLPDNLPGHLQ